MPVHEVHDLTVEGPAVQRELALIKVAGKGDHRIEALRLAEKTAQTRQRCQDAEPDGTAMGLHELPPIEEQARHPRQLAGRRHRRAIGGACPVRRTPPGEGAAPLGAPAEI